MTILVQCPLKKKDFEYEYPSGKYSMHIQMNIKLYEMLISHTNGTHSRAYQPARMRSKQLKIE